MSEVKTNEATETKKFEIKVEKHPKFDYLFKSALWTSTELCHAVNSLFKNVYADWEGSTFEMINGSSNFMCALHFNHKNNDNSSMVNACTLHVDTSIKNNIVQGRRSMDMRNKNGDRYYLTAEGKEGIGKFIQDNDIIRDKKSGSFKWDKIVQEVADDSIPFTAYGAIRSQYTKVSFIDPNKILQEIYGGVDEDGNKLCYNVRVVGTVSTYSQTNNSKNKVYRLAIDVVSENNLVEYANKNGFSGMFSGLNIIR